MARELTRAKLGELYRDDERLRAVSWPSAQPVESLLVDPGDLLLQCAGFEQRSTSALTSALRAGSRDLSVLLIEYLPEYSENRGDEIRQKAQRAGVALACLVYDRRRPAGIGEEVLALCETARRVFIDISGMSRLLIVQLLVALLRRRSHAVSIIYTEAEEYPPSRSEVQEEIERQGIGRGIVSYLSTGIFEVAATPELGAVAMVGEPIRLIAFPSFDPAQLRNLVDELQPTYTELVHGVPPRRRNGWRLDAIRELNASVSRALSGADEHVASTLDYRETLDLLLESYARRSMFDRIVVAPTGSKMQAVAVGLLRAALTDIQIVYPTPHQFTEPERHTVGVRQIYRVDLPAELPRTGDTGLEEITPFGGQ